MSPDTYFYSEEDLERQVIVQDIRHNYGFIFSQIERIFDFYYPDYNKKLSRRAEDIETRVQILRKDEYLSDYLYLNYFAVMKHYPSMLVGNLVKEREKDGENKQFERLKNLKTLLEIYIGDLCEELSDIIKNKIDYDEREIIKQYFN